MGIGKNAMTKIPQKYYGEIEIKPFANEVQIMESGEIVAIEIENLARLIEVLQEILNDKKL